MVAVFHIGSIVIGHGAISWQWSSRLYRYSHGSLDSGQEVWSVIRCGEQDHRALTDFAEDNRVKPIPWRLITTSLIWILYQQGLQSHVYMCAHLVSYNACVCERLRQQGYLYAHPIHCRCLGVSIQRSGSNWWVDWDSLILVQSLFRGVYTTLRI